MKKTLREAILVEIESQEEEVNSIESALDVVNDKLNKVEGGYIHIAESDATYLRPAADKATIDQVMKDIKNW